jgi:hypothetical protein
LFKVSVGIRRHIAGCEGILPDITWGLESVINMDLMKSGKTMTDHLHFQCCSNLLKDEASRGGRGRCFIRVRENKYESLSGMRPAISWAPTMI